MDYNRSDNSGTDDDLPPPHQHRFARNARVTRNGRTAVAASTYPRRPNNDMETQIHCLEQEAYCSVLRAFKAQSDDLTREKESLISKLRKELKVSVEEHKDFLSRVNSDDMIKEIRDWRQSNGHQQGMPSSFSPVHESVPSPTVSASRNKQKAGQSVSALAGGGALTPANGMHPSLQPSSSNLKRGPPPGSRGNKTKEIDPIDIKWDGDKAGQGRGFNKSLARGGGAIGGERGRGTLKGVGRKGVKELKLLNTDALIKEVNNVFSATNPDPVEAEEVKKLLKEHEEALEQAVAMLQDSSDGESDVEHQDSLSKVNIDDMIKRLRDLRQSSKHQQGKKRLLPIDESESVPSPTVSTPLKKQKTSHSVSALPDASALPPPNAMSPSPQPSKSGRSPLFAAIPRRPRSKNHSTFAGTLGANEGANEPDKAQTIDQHIGKKVWIRWPDDNKFYEALITDYKEGLHSLVYDMNTENESLEWLNLKEIAPEDIRWDNHRQDRKSIRCLARGGGVIGPVRGRGKGRPKKNFRPQNGIRRIETEIKLSNTKALISKVEEIFSDKNADPMEVNKAKTAVDEHAIALEQAIPMLEDASDGESDGEDHLSSQGYKPLD